MTRPLEATLVEVFMSIRQLQVLGGCKHDNAALGGYICVIHSLWLMIEMNNLDFFKLVTFILKQVLSFYYVPFLRLGGYKWYAYKGGTLSSLMLATIMTRCHQTGIFGDDKPASSTSSSRLKIRWVYQDQYFFIKHWKLSQMDYVLQYFSTMSKCQQIDYEARLLTHNF